MNRRLCTFALALLLVGAGPPAPVPLHGDPASPRSASLEVQPGPVGVSMVLTAGARPLRRLVATATPLVDTHGATAGLAWTLPDSVEAHGSVLLTGSGELPAGAWRGQVQVLGEGLGSPVSIALTLQAAATTPPPKLVLRGPDTVRATLGGGAPSGPRLYVAETGGAPLTATVSLGEVEAQAQAPPADDLTLTSAAGQALAVQLPAHGQQVLTTRLAGLPGPGSWKTAVVARDPSGTLATHVFTLHARRPWWQAGLVVVGGTLGSVLLFLLLWRVRPELDRKRRTAALAAHMRAAPPTTEPVATGLRDSLQRQLMAADTDAAVSAVADGWELYRAWEAARAELDAAHELPEAERSKLATRLEAGRAGVSDLSKAADRSRLAGDLRAVRVDVVAGRQRALSRALADMQTGVRSLPPGSDVARAVQPHLAEGQRALRDGDLVAAGAALSLAGTAWSAAAAAALRAMVEGSPPPGHDDASWQAEAEWLDSELCTVDALLPHERPAALADLEDALTARLLARTDTALRSLLADSFDGAIEQMSEQQRTTWSGARHQLLTATQALTGGQAEAARTAWVQAADGLRTFDQHRGAREVLGLLGGFTGRVPAFPRPGGAAAQPQLGAAPPVAPHPALHGLVAGAIHVLVLVAVALAGVAALWSPDAGWGTTEDVLAALLWGLGLQGLGFTGTSALLKKAFDLEPPA